MICECVSCRVPPEGANVSSRRRNPRNARPQNCPALKGPNKRIQQLALCPVVRPFQGRSRPVVYPGFHPGLFMFHPFGMQLEMHSAKAKAVSRSACHRSPK